MRMCVTNLSKNDLLASPMHMYVCMCIVKKKTQLKAFKGQISSKEKWNTAQSRSALELIVCGRYFLNTHFKLQWTQLNVAAAVASGQTVCPTTSK